MKTGVCRCPRQDSRSLLCLQNEACGVGPSTGPSRSPRNKELAGVTLVTLTRPGPRPAQHWAWVSPQEPFLVLICFPCVRETSRGVSEHRGDSRRPGPLGSRGGFSGHLLLAEDGRCCLLFSVAMDTTWESSVILGLVSVSVNAGATEPSLGCGSPGQEPLPVSLNSTCPRAACRGDAQLRAGLHAGVTLSSAKGWDTAWFPRRPRRQLCGQVLPPGPSQAHCVMDRQVGDG